MQANPAISNDACGYAIFLPNCELNNEITSLIKSTPIVQKIKLSTLDGFIDGAENIASWQQYVGINMYVVPLKFDDDQNMCKCPEKLVNTI